MARDVEFNYTASDRTGPAADSVTRRMRKTGDQVKKDGEKISSDFAKGIISMANVVSPKLAKSLTGAFESAAGAAPVALGAGVALAAPLIAATLSGAIIGGAGIGGVVGGVILASKDPRIQSAGKQLGSSLLSNLTSDAQVFVGPVLNGLGQIRGEADQLEGRFRSIFANSAQYVAPLVSGLTRAVDGIVRGIDSLVANAGPVIGEISDGLGDVGNAIGDAFEEIASNGPEAAEAIHDVFTATEDLIGVTGSTISVLTQLYGVISYIPRKLSDVGGKLKDLVVGSGEVGTITKVAAHGIADVGDQAIISADAVNWFTQQLDDAAQAGKSLFDASTQVGEALDKASEAAKKNGRTLDANTEKGRANRDALSQVAGSLTAKYDAEVKANGETTKSTAIAESNRATFVRVARQLGATKTQAEQLANTMIGIPSKKDLNFHANTEGAQNKVKNLKNDIAGLRDKTVDVVVRASISDKVQNTLNRFGGTFAADAGFAFAARGQTVVEPARPVNVHSDVESRLYLDGTLIYTNTARQVRATSKRDAWRQKVGRR